MVVRALDIELALREAFSPSALQVQDDANLHVGHAGAREGGHFTVRISSARFAGLTRAWRDIASCMMPCTV